MSLAGMRSAYERSGDAWVAGPEAVYQALAAALVASAPVAVAHARVLDLGAGTGVAARAALTAGAARVVALDSALGMLRRARPALRPVVADAYRLPFADDAFDLVLAAAVIGHLPDPVRALRESRRVGAALAASAFAADFDHPAKAAVDGALAPFGFRVPDWYLTFKRDVERQVGDPARFAEFAASAGYVGVRSRTVEVVTGVSSPAALAAWRLGMAYLSPFLASLDEDERMEARRAAEAAVVGAPPLVVPLVVLTAT
jgi:SAM-dependent methyltransferase